CRVSVNADNACLWEVLKKILGMPAGSQGAINDDCVLPCCFHSWGNQFSHPRAHDGDMSVVVVDIEVDVGVAHELAPPFLLALGLNSHTYPCRICLLIWALR